MVDVPPARNFIVVVSFLGIYAIGLMLIPSQLLSTEFDIRAPTYNEEYWDLPSIESLANTYNITADNGGLFYSEAWGIDEGFGHNFLFKINEVDGEIKIENQHYFLWLIFPVGHHSMDWIAKGNGKNYEGFLVQSEFDVTAETSDENITSASYTVQCEHVAMHAVVGFNYTLYANATDAFNNDALTVEFGIEWDELGTGLNAWNIISSILFFQAPEINPYVNAILAIPLWAAIGWLAYALIMAAISVLPFT
jgi:hypothetical protein